MGLGIVSQLAQGRGVSKGGPRRVPLSIQGAPHGGATAAAGLHLAAAAVVAADRGRLLALLMHRGGAHRGFHSLLWRELPLFG